MKGNLLYVLGLDAISKTISRNIGMLTKLKHYVPGHIMHSLYCTLVLPYINYSNLILILYSINKVILLFIIIIMFTQGRNYIDLWVGKPMGTRSRGHPKLNGGGKKPNTIGDGVPILPGGFSLRNGVRGCSKVLRCI